MTMRSYLVEEDNNDGKVSMDLVLADDCEAWWSSAALQRSLAASAEGG